MLGSDPSHWRTSISGLKHNPGIAVHWTAKEQSLLEELITTYAPLSHSRVIWCAAIASHFTNKTMRDVALRYRWMTLKENEKIRVDSSDTNGAPKIINANCTTEGISAADCPTSELRSPPEFDTNDNGEISITDMEGKARELLAENTQMFNQMSANLDSFLQPDDNVFLLWQTRQNLESLLNHNSANIPEKAERMLPIPGIEEALFDAILPLQSNMADFSEQGFLNSNSSHGFSNSD